MPPRDEKTSGVKVWFRNADDSAVQKTFIEVKEEGTEASAVTGVAACARAIVMPPVDAFTMVVDRPFVFLIEDSQTGAILFMGVVYEPKAE